MSIEQKMWKLKKRYFAKIWKNVEKSQNLLIVQKLLTISYNWREYQQTFFSLYYHLKNDFSLFEIVDKVENYIFNFKAIYQGK